MLDIKFIRENPDAVRENIKKKFQDAKLPLVDEVIALDAKTATLAAALENTGLAVQAQDGANWIELLTDPTAFTLQTRDATGVEHVPQPYHIGEDGLPALGTN